MMPPQALVVEYHGLLPYHLGHRRQLYLVEQLRRDRSRPDTCMILQHPPVFTLGRNGSTAHLTVDEAFLNARGIDLLRVERGGEITYHGPGQLVCYPIVDLRRSALSVVAFVRMLEEVMLEVAASFGITAGRDPRNHGIWVAQRKIGSVGIAVRHSIAFHGLALNVNPDMEPFGWVNPCGLKGVSVTSMEIELGKQLAFDKVTEQLIEALGLAFQRPVRCLMMASVGDSAPEKARCGKPTWLKKRLPSGSGYERTRRLVAENKLLTVCAEARCPNQFECYAKGTATFMIMGDWCTRNCGFCAVSSGSPDPLDPDEPARIGDAVAAMQLNYAVITSVTRDDLPDGGAAHFVATIEAIRRQCPATSVEVLIPDFQGNEVALRLLCRHRPAVLNHNIETVPRLYSQVRPQADYHGSLELLRTAKRCAPEIVIKSGLMVGLGETIEEMKQTMAEIHETGCDLLTLGQYLRPTSAHLPVTRFVCPEDFQRLREFGLGLGFKGVAAGPHIRSSYRAFELFTLAETAALSFEH